MKFCRLLWPLYVSLCELLIAVITRDNVYVTVVWYLYAQLVWSMHVCNYYSLIAVAHSLCYLTCCSTAMRLSQLLCFGSLASQEGSEWHIRRVLTRFRQLSRAQQAQPVPVGSSSSSFIIIIIIINIFVKLHRQSYRGAVNESIRRR